MLRRISLLALLLAQAMPVFGQVIPGADGRFLSRVRSSYEGGPLVLWQGEGQAPVVAQFSDPAYDASHVGPDKRVHVVRAEEIADAMVKCGFRCG